MNKLSGVSVELVRKTDKDLVLIFRGLPVYIANSIRRACIADVPVLAVDKVYVFENTSVMNDQMLAHRLGLVPLKTPLGKYRLKEECDCGGECPKCTVYLQLKAEAGNDYVIVKAGDIKSEDPEVYPLYPEIEIVKLAPGQKLELTLAARMGRGREHAKWSPVTVAVVRGEPVVNIDEAKCDGCGACVEACPKKVLRVEDGKARLVDKLGCTTCGLCADACGKEAISVDIDESSSILYIESVGQLDPMDIVIAAFDEVIKKLDDFIVSFGEAAKAQQVAGQAAEAGGKG
ncbi:DNA-directed RNA polymerase subunit D [Candidatus Geothermarchaeota archaeon ex4572_27]|nr:MAG: DNA-directed RNA polymerase subunit D [Candidatus Geothermarchaeota archaeon ex4572_27]